tara:strand:- start:167 stop:832 length:666 start_codon:yes stop_codon:yes gene_type:complete
MLDVIIAIDDLHPEQGWGCEGDASVVYLENLWEEFGCKFTLFVPSNYHDNYPLSKYKDWVNFWLSKDWAELAAHGHYHMCDDKRYGECEFLEINSWGLAEQRVAECLTEWHRVGYKPKGWRNPGWVAHPESIKIIDKYFDYVALHSVHNRGVEWKSKMFFGCDSINKTDVSILDNRIMFQSHIAGDWNDNIWNSDNYEQFKVSLDFLVNNNEIEFKTMGEL